MNAVRKSEEEIVNQFKKLKNTNYKCIVFLLQKLRKLVKK